MAFSGVVQKPLALAYRVFELQSPSLGHGGPHQEDGRIPERIATPSLHKRALSPAHSADISDRGVLYMSIFHNTRSASEPLNLGLDTYFEAAIAAEAIWQQRWCTPASI